jgi:hypothetical protein
MAFKEVYKAGGGWVKQFKDGTILGPFENQTLAMAAQRPEEESLKKDLFKSKSVDKKG